MARFQGWEREMALADHRCQVPLGEATSALYDEVLRDVVGPHREELENLVAAWP